MAQTHLEIFPSEYHMLKFFGKYLPLLDVDTSARLSPFLYSYDSKFVMGRNLHDFLLQMEEMTALGIDYRASVKKGPTFLVFFHEVPKTPEKFLADVKEIKAARENIIPDDAESVDFGEEINKVIDTKPVANEEDPEKTKILEHAASLKDDSKKAASKSALEEYALTIGVSLSKSKTFDAMIEDLKAAI